MTGEDRTEKATAKRRRLARRQGQVARSGDVGGSLVLAAGLFAIGLTGPRIVDAGAQSFRGMLAGAANPARATSAAGLSELLHAALGTIVVTVGPVAGICMATGLLAGAAQVGFRPTVHALKPDFRRINPLSGMRNLLGPNLAFEAAKATMKVSLVALVAALALIPGLPGLASQVGIPPIALGVLLDKRAMSIAQHAVFAYLAVAVVDYLWQRHRHEQRLRMTKQEVKDELREHGLSAEVKVALRRRQMQAARTRMMAEVPSADVVVANPTHYAVALRYDGSRAAPEVLAKGRDLIAAQIRRIAERSGVPVIVDPPLARALHDSTEIGQVIPEELYGAVARVLAFVYRISGRSPLAAGARAS